MSHRKTEGGCIILSTVECLHSNSILIYSSYLNVQFLPFSFLNLPFSFPNVPFSFQHMPFLLHIGPFPKRWVLLFAVYAFLRSHFCLLDLKCAPFRPRCAVFLPTCPSFLFPLVPLYPFRVINIFQPWWRWNNSKQVILEHLKYQNLLQVKTEFQSSLFRGFEKL